MNVPKNSFSRHAHANKENPNNTHSSFEFTRENFQDECCFDVVLLMQREAKPVFNCKTKWFMHGALPCLCEHVAFIVLSPSPNARLGLPTLCWSMVTFKMRSLAGILGGGGWRCQSVRDVARSGSNCLSVTTC